VYGDHPCHRAIAHGYEVGIFVVEFIDELVVTGIRVLWNFPHEGLVIEMMNGFIFFFRLCFFKGIAAELKDRVVALVGIDPMVI